MDNNSQAMALACHASPDILPIMADIELSPQFVHALELMENSPDSLFITGRAGTGKSTLLSYFKKNTLQNIVILMEVLMIR